MDMANAIGETRAVARQGSSRHDEMDGRPGGWMDFGSGMEPRQTRPAPACYGTVSRLDRQRQSWGVRLRAGLGTVSQGKELGWTHLDLDD